MVDDMGYGDVQISGNPNTRTPNLTQLANESVQFEYFYVSPVCAPTRASLLTGRYHQEVGVRSVTNGFETMNPEAVTLAEILKEKGYSTGIFGKWHLGEYEPSHPNHQGFDSFVGFRTGHTAIYDDAVLERNGESYSTKGYLTDVLTDEAISFMDSAKESPFFCYLAYQTPHTPLHIDTSLYRPYLQQGLNEKTARLYAMIEGLDANIGRLMDHLKASNLDENTVVIFLSDNGPISGWKLPQEKMRFNAGLRDQKFTIYEGGIRTQSYWKWGNRWKKGTTQELAAHIDVVPTLLDVLNIAEPDDVDGISLIPVLENVNSSLPDRIYFENYSLETLREPAPFPGGMARQDVWKMVNGEELYQLDIDPSEQKNLKNAYPEKLDSMKTAYLSWYNSVHKSQGFFPKPIPVGYPDVTSVHVQPHHGHTEGNLKFTGHRGIIGEKIGNHPSGVDGDWISNWKSHSDQITWELDILDEKSYQIDIKVRGQCQNSSSELILNIGEKSFPVKLNAIQSDWAYIEIGDIHLPKGTTQLKLSAGTIEPDCEVEVREVIIE
ncbi:UNVERIFIED_CONTAM: hypothetical protein GTU68_044040 [Idotea baltica]|nr:hypothetical protein [Idotea baltica]